jgi:antitoxin ParD1/3/4
MGISKKQTVVAMNSYRTITTVIDSGRVVITNVPFVAGQQVEVIVQPAGKNGSGLIELKSLLKETQALGQVQALTDAEIEAEVAAYRDGR